jgi:bacillithiol biosynthesis cysteine-adding enzyme BshC
MAHDLAAGRAVAVIAGHQIGLFTGPLFTLLKALDAIRVARELSLRGVPAVPVFYILTDDHDLEEIAKTARPGPDGPQILVLEGADRANRRPVGLLAIPEGVRQIIEAFRPDARSPEATEILEAFARRSSPGTTYAAAFVETLFDLVDEPLLVLDPLAAEARAVAADLFRRAAEQRGEIDRNLAASDERILHEDRPVPVPYRPGVFPFFLVHEEERRRIEDIPSALAQISDGSAWPSADVLTRPVLKSFLLPAAASILGPAEIAYHAQSLPLFPLLGVRPPVLLPRSHVVLLGPPERRAADGLGVARADLLAARPTARQPTPEADSVESLGQETDQRLASLAQKVSAIDPTLEGALETTRRKVAYQMAQLAERIRKAAERKDAVREKRQKRLETMVRPGGTAAERVYPPLVPLLSYGRAVLGAIRSGAIGSLQGGVIVELDGASEEEKETSRAG